ncbi:MAG: hypothetical protein ACO1N9_00445 [Flavobacterium sp.]
MKYFFTITCLIVMQLSFAQTDTTTSVTIDSHIISDIASSDYTDYEYGYSIIKPEWLKVRESGDLSMWGGTLPAVEGIENVIYVKGYKKDRFKSFDEFEHIFITGNKFGEKTLYSQAHTWYGRNERDLKK